MDTLTKEQRSERMARIRSKNTKPELSIRKLVFHLGFRYRLHASDLPGKPDLVFRGVKKAIFVHGCFWHMHKGCKLARLPKSRISFWKKKLEDNRGRDSKNHKKLLAMGWRILIIWECEVHDVNAIANKVLEFMHGNA